MKQYCFGIIQLILGVHLCAHCFAQTNEHINYRVIEKNIYTKTIGTEEGLPSSETYEVNQDSKGYIWISTDRGVAKYDGVEMKVFTTNNGLPDNVIFDIFEDSEGIMWLSSMNGNMSYIKDDKVFLLDSAEEHLLVNYHGSIKYFITEDELGDIWFGYNKNVNNVTVYNKAKNELRAVPVFTNKDTITNLIYEFKNGNILHYPNSVMYNTKPRDNNITIVKDSIVDIIKLDSVFSTHPFFDFNNFKGARGRFVKVKENVYAATTQQSEMFLFQKKNNKWEKNEFFFEHPVANLNIDDDFNIWVGIRGGGIYKIDSPEDTVLEHYLPGLTVADFCIDRDNGYWFSTVERGVQYCADIALEKVISTPEEDNNTIIEMNTCGDYLQILQHRGNYISIDKEQNITRGDSKLLLRDIFCINNYSYYQINNGSMYNIYTHDITYNLLPENYVLRAFFGDKYSVTWQSKAFSVSKKNKPWVAYSDLIKDNIQCVLENEDGVYFGTTKNLLYYHFDSREIEVCNEIKVDVTNMLWYGNQIILSTKGSGLYQYINDTLIPFYGNNLLPSNSCNDIVIQNHTLLVGTSNGVVSFNLQEPNTNTLLNTYHGLPGNEIRNVEFFNNYFWVSSPNHVSKIPFEHKGTHSRAPQIWIESIFVNDSIAYNGQQLMFNQNSLSITVTNDVYCNLGQKKFKYRFANENSWYFFSGKEIVFRSLPKGDYQLEIQAINSDGVSSDKSAIVEFTILPPWYKTNWFLILMVILGVGIVYTVLKIRSKAVIKKIEQEEAYKRQLSEMELKALRSQMNPHFLFNAINSIQYFLIKNKGEEAKGYLSKFSLLVRNVLNHSRQEFITLEEEIKGLKLYMDIEKLRFESEFDYEVNVSSELDSDFDKVPVMMIQPFVENAIWHGLMQKKEGKGKILIEFGVKDDSIVVSVEDNGIGRAETKRIKENQIENKRTSLGLQIINERINLFNTYRSQKMEFFVIDLYSKNNKPQGTKVILYIPFV
jgi:ligand-binding sensor domain-containing protein